MRSRFSVLPILLAALIAGVRPVSAQTAAPALRGPDSSTRTYVPGIDILPLAGVPFSAVDRIVWTRPGSIVRYLDAKAARDSEGRLYREHHRFGRADVDPEKTLEDFTISDPVTRLQINCVRASHTCHVTKYRPPLSAAVRPVGPFDQGRRYLTRDSLGTKFIDNYSVVGTLETTTIAPGTVGNEALLTLTREFWYSPDLKTNLAVTRADPREGTQAISLVNISRNEPDASLFAVPAGYAIVDDRGVVVRGTQTTAAPPK